MRKRVDIVSVKMVKESSTMYDFREVTGPSSLYDICKPFLENEDREKMLVVCFNTKNEPTHISTVSIGNLNSSIVHPREVMKIAILSNSAKFALAHNHPSGNPEPSTEDINITKRMKEVGTILGIELLDHIIIGDNKYISLKSKCVF